MISTQQSRIDELVARGYWGTDTLHSLLKQRAAERGHCLAVKDQPNRRDLTGDPPLALSWAELDRASDNLARDLRALGVGAEDAVVAQLPNVAELLLLYYTLSKLGAVLSPVPVQYGRHELRMLAEALKARFMITLPALRERQLAEEARDALPGIRVLAFGQDLHVDTAHRQAAALATVDDANRVLTICWTSGTTGTPKGVPRSHNMWLATGRRSSEAGAYLPDDVLLNPFPLVNMAALGGFLFPGALIGCAVVLHQPLDAAVFLRQIQDERVSFTIAPPALLNQLAKSPETWKQFDFSRLRRVGSGSTPLAPWMIEVFDSEYGKPVVNFYGSNEGVSLYATPESAPTPEMRAAMFRQPDADSPMSARVMDPDSGRTLSSVGERGELLISGATVFDGYYQYDNSDVFTPDGYFRTGDLVEICGEDGRYLRIVGRCKDIINRGGMKISPAEIDVALEQYPGLQEAAVCAYPDERLGEKICACIVTKPGVAPPDLESLQQHLLDQGFAKFKLPERLALFEQLPRNPLGKVQRFVLQERLGKGS